MAQLPALVNIIKELKIYIKKEEDIGHSYSDSYTVVSFCDPDLHMQIRVTK